MEDELQLWIKLIIDGEITAFEKIYEYTRDDVYRTVSYLVINKDDVNDIVNEIYIQMLKSLPNYDMNRPFDYSGANRPLIPVQTGHPFRRKPATYSGPNRPPEK